MKKRQYILWSIMLLLISAFTAIGQINLINELDYSAVAIQPQTYLKSVSYRTKSLTKKYTSGKLSGTVTITVENLPPDKTRELRLEEEGNSVKKLEKIVIGDFEYSRNNDGDWKKYEKEMILQVLASTEVCKQYTVEEKMIGNQTFKIYSLSRVSVWEKKMTFENFLTYIDSNGLIQKTEWFRSEINPNNLTSETVRTYEYNPKDLKIEAPIK